MAEPFRPGTAAELAELVAAAAGAERALEITGAGSKRAFDDLANLLTEPA